jgi:hypothetical protein
MQKPGSHVHKDIETELVAIKNHLEVVAEPKNMLDQRHSQTNLILDKLTIRLTVNRS